MGTIMIETVNVFERSEACSSAISNQSGILTQSDDAHPIKEDSDFHVASIKLTKSSLPPMALEILLAAIKKRLGKYGSDGSTASAAKALEQACTAPTRLVIYLTSVVKCSSCGAGCANSSLCR